MYLYCINVTDSYDKVCILQLAVTEYKCMCVCVCVLCVCVLCVCVCVCVCVYVCMRHACVYVCAVACGGMPDCSWFCFNN